LIGDRPLKRIPILHDIVAMTLEASAAGEGAAPEETADEGETLLAGADLGDAFLDGYLTALCIAPVAPAPELWLGTLLGGIGFPGEGAIKGVIAAISARVERIEEAAPDPVAVAAHLSPFGADGLQDWCTGFHALVTAAQRSWPARGLGPDDKRLLRTISLVAKGEPDPTLAAVLPAWIAQRHARRT
jgi:hypothetical protein